MEKSGQIAPIYKYNEILSYREPLYLDPNTWSSESKSLFNLFTDYF